jgi:hypothetical protein
MKDALMRPKHPERICWGCERYCPANDLSCREDRVAHPIEFFGGSWEIGNLAISQEVTDQPDEINQTRSTRRDQPGEQIERETSLAFER